MLDKCSTTKLQPPAPYLLFLTSAPLPAFTPSPTHKAPNKLISFLLLLIRPQINLLSSFVCAILRIQSGFSGFPFDIFSCFPHEILCHFSVAMLIWVPRACSVSLSTIIWSIVDTWSCLGVFTHHQMKIQSALGFEGGDWFQEDIRIPSNGIVFVYNLCTCSRIP